MKSGWKRWLAAGVLMAGCCTFVPAQDKAPLPDAPSDAQTPKKPEPVVTKDGTVVLEAPIPEPAAGDAVFAPLATAGADTLHRKFMSYAVVSFGPRALFSPAIPAAIRQARPNKNYPLDWQRGADAFGRNYGSALGTKVAGQTARFAVGAALHEDFRYRPTWIAGMMQMRAAAGKAGGPSSDPATRKQAMKDMMAHMPTSNKNVPERILYAIGFTFVDRSDSGHMRLALANFSSAAASGFVANAYLPDGFNDASHGARRMGTRFGSFALQNVLREFSPEIFKVSQKLHIPFPRLPIPEWWVKRPSER